VYARVATQFLASVAKNPTIHPYGFGSFSWAGLCLCASIDEYLLICYLDFRDVERNYSGYAFAYLLEGLLLS
jgi:hypothetical protein